MSNLSRSKPGKSRSLSAKILSEGVAGAVLILALGTFYAATNPEFEGLIQFGYKDGGFGFTLDTRQPSPPP